MRLGLGYGLIPIRSNPITYAQTIYRFDRARALIAALVEASNEASDEALFVALVEGVRGQRLHHRLAAGALHVSERGTVHDLKVKHAR